MTPTPDDAIPAMTPMHEHVEQFWRLLETEHVRILVNMRRDTSSMTYWDSSSFSDDVAKAILADRRNRPAVAGEVVVKALEKAAQIAGDAFWSLPMPKHWDRDKAQYSDWCSAQSKRVREKISAIASGQEIEPAAPVRVTDETAILNAAYSDPDYVGGGFPQRDEEGLLFPGSPYDRGRYDARKAVKKAISTALASAEPEG